MGLSKATAVAVAVTLAVGLAACGDSDDSPPDVPDGAVAVVGQQAITRAELEQRVATLRHAQRVSAKQQGGKAGEQQIAANDKALERQALSMLLQTAALEQEAKARGVKVTAAEVRERWKAAIGKQFHNKRQLRRFLGGQTQQDVLGQLRLQLLGERILADVGEDAGGGKDGAKAVKGFQKEFQKRWTEKTSCDDSRQGAGMCAER